MERFPDLSSLSPAEKDALIRALWARVAELEAKLGVPPKTPDNSSLPPSWGKKPNCTAPGSLDNRLSYAARLRVWSCQAARMSLGLRWPFFSISHSAL